MGAIKSNWKIRTKMKSLKSQIKNPNFYGLT